MRHFKKKTLSFNPVDDKINKYIATSTNSASMFTAYPFQNKQKKTFLCIEESKDGY